MSPKIIKLTLLADFSTFAASLFCPSYNGVTVGYLDIISGITLSLISSKISVALVSTLFKSAET